MRTTSLSIICLFFALCSGQSPSIPEPRNDEVWHGRHNAFVANSASNPGIPCIFYGASIIDWWSREGLLVFNRYYAIHGAVNYGIHGDQIQNLLWRVQNGEVAGLSPRVIVLQIGSNNLASASPSEIANGIYTIIRTLRDRLPGTKILLVSFLPRSGVANFDSIAEVNSLLAQYDNGQDVWFLNLFDHFRGPVWGTVNPALFWDGLHLTETGYQLWAEKMNSLFNHLIQSE